MADLDLDAVKARCDAAPPGPWAAIDGGEDRDWHGMPLDWMVRFGPDDRGGGTRYGFDQVTAEFIAHARQDVPALVAEVERLRAERAELLDALEDMARQHFWRYDDGALGHEHLGVHEDVCDLLFRHRPNRWVLTMDGIAEAAESTDG